MLPIYACQQFDPATGDPCNFTSKRKFNLDRHVGRRHQKTISGFVQYIVGDHGILGKGKPAPNGPRRQAEPVTIRVSTPQHQGLPPSTNLNLLSVNSSRSSNIEPLLSPFLDQGHLRAQNSEISHQALRVLPADTVALQIDTVNAIVHSANEDAIAKLCPSPFLRSTSTIASNANLEASPENTDSIKNFKDTSTALAETTTRNSMSTPLVPRRTVKERTSKRLFESLERESLPVYQVKRSKKWSLQQGGVDWLTQVGKTHFDRYFAARLAPWGLKETHKGTCVLSPADWDAIDPLRLASLFSAENCPHAWAEGVVN